MTTNSMLLAIVFSLFASTAHALKISGHEIQNGDLIFQQSQSHQSFAIREATGSAWTHVGIIFEKRGKWFVGEAAATVVLTPLNKFMARGKNGLFKIFRARGLTPTQRASVRSAFNQYLGTPYDIYFEWTDDAIYCTELTYKVFKSAAGIDLGAVQKYSELKLDGPFVKMMIYLRLERTGRKLNLDEPIVTPVSQMYDADLDLIVSN